jgi:hypothetical protein
MDIDNYAMEKKLREIMYSALGYHKKNEFWRKTKPEKKQRIKGQIQCSKCMEYFDEVFIIKRNRNNYCNECEKAIV